MMDLLLAVTWLVVVLWVLWVIVDYFEE